MNNPVIAFFSIVDNVAVMEVSMINLIEIKIM